MSKGFAVSLDSVRLSDAGRVGQKAAALGDLIHLGLEVPPGFCVTPAAVESLLQVYSEFSPAHSKGPADLERAVLRTPLPPDLEGEIRRAYRALARRPEGGWTAVRLSDLDSGPNGGAFGRLTYAALGMKGWDEVLDAVRRCWASSYSPKALRLRPARAASQANPPAVVVQAMVNATCAGVAFSARQKTARTVVVEACWGLGPSLMNGLSLPDRYHLVTSASGRLRLRRTWVGSKEIAAAFLPPTPENRRAAAGQILPLALPGMPPHAAEVLSREGRNLALFRTPEALRRAECVTTQQLEELAGTVLALEDYYREPQTVEWAIGACGPRQGLFILQTQPAPRADAGCGPEASLPGRTVAGGLARGQALVINGPAAAEAQGSVLVAHSLTPEFIPLMLKARAVVTEVGGVLSHAAILAREMGIPFLTGVSNATRRFATGDHLEVDGLEGRVTRLGPGSLPASPAGPAKTRASGPAGAARPASRGRPAYLPVGAVSAPGGAPK